jgi:hypothetical protein
MNGSIEWVARFFGHISVTGVEVMLVHGVRAALVLLAVTLGFGHERDLE